MSKTSVITNRGVSIVRSAANRHDECVFVDAVSSTHFENTPNELATKPDYWWDGVKGEIVAVQSGASFLKVQVEFKPTHDAQPLKSIGLRICSGSDSDRAYLLYAESDGNSAVVLNAAYSCVFELPINVSGDVIKNVGEFPDIETVEQQIDALRDEIAGEYISSVSYDSETNTLHFESPNGEKKIDINLG